MPGKKTSKKNDHDKVISEMKELYEDKLKENQALKNLLKAISQPLPAIGSVKIARENQTESKP